MIRAFILGCCLFGWGGAQAQSNTVAAGGDFTGAGGSISQSLGQVAFMAHSGSAGSVAEGVQQAYIPDDLHVAAAQKRAGNISVYPNPASHTTVLYVPGADKQSLHYQLYDLQGREVVKGPVRQDFTSVSLEGLATAPYFLKVTGNKQETVIFKIIKNK